MLGEKHIDLTTNLILSKCSIVMKWNALEHSINRTLDALTSPHQTFKARAMFVVVIPVYDILI